MNSMVIVLTLCLHGNAEKCREEDVTVLEDISQFQCMMGSQVEIAKYMELRPRWFVKRWTCVPPEKLQKGI